MCLELAMPDENTRPPTRQKALAINLAKDLYGTFSEIGAGQEVARWFFKVGGTSGTIAKTMSAYDMTISDVIYGKAERYVSLPRLETMVRREFDLLVKRLTTERGRNTRFFSFADTVKAKSYRGEGESHGWMGISFQHKPKAEPSEIILHLRMLDTENVQQQEALGIIGVNLVYGAMMLYRQPETLVRSLLDELSADRIEVDMIRFNGPAFKGVDNRLMSLQLVQHGLSEAAMFKANGEVVQPSELFYKRSVLVERGSFRPATKVSIDMLERDLLDDGAERHDVVMFVMFPLHKCPVDTFDIETGVISLIDQFLNIVTLKPDHLLIVLEFLFSIPPDLTVPTHLLPRWQNNTTENEIPCIPGLGIKHIKCIPLILHT